MKKLQFLHQVQIDFGTIKARMGATHFLMKTLPRVASEMALHVLAYNLTRVMAIMGIQPLMTAMRASPEMDCALPQDRNALALPLQRFHTTKTRS